MLHRSGLVVADVTGQGRQLRIRRDKRKRQEWLQTLGNILCIRFKGFDPERFLNLLYPYFRWFFSVPAAVLCLLVGHFGAAAGRGRVRRFPRKTARVPPVFQHAQRLPLGADLGRDQSISRVRPRPVVQALRRRMPRNRHHDPRAHALHVLQRFRLLDAAQQVAPRHDRRGRHLRGAGDRLDLHFFMVVFRAGPAEQSVLKRHVHLLGKHGAFQRQPACCVTTATTSFPT